jgi:hypothetical protein
VEGHWNPNRPPKPQEEEEEVKDDIDTLQADGHGRRIMCKTDSKVCVLQWSQKEPNE